MRIRGSAFEPLLRVGTSIILGSLFYIVWLAGFLLVSPVTGFLNISALIFAPLITSIGYALGIFLFNWFFQCTQWRFFPTLVWPLIGCFLGGLVVYWFGPMLIVFGILLGGAISIITREMVNHLKNKIDF